VYLFVRNIKEKRKEMKQKANEGVKTAVERVRQHNQQVWWDLQSKDYQVKAKKRRKAKAITDAKFKERKELVNCALFHYW
jgi:hypothetical protein